MKSSIIVGVVALGLGLLPTEAWAQGLRGHGGFHGGFHSGGGGFHGHFGGFQGGFGHPGFQGFGHFGHLQHEQFFGPHHHFGPFAPFGHEQHFAHEFFFGPHHHFFGGFPGGFQRGFFFGQPFFLGAPRVVVINTPFFCFPDGLGFTEQALFFDHLLQFHGIPPDQALSFCTPLLGGRRFLFFGF